MTKRGKQLNILLSTQEMLQLNALSRARGLNVSDTLRGLLRRESEVGQWLSPFEIDAAMGNAIKEAKEASRTAPRKKGRRKKNIDP